MHGLVDLKHCQEGGLWDLHITYLFHALFPCLLLLKKLFLSRYIAAITFCSHVLS